MAGTCPARFSWTSSQEPLTASVRDRQDGSSGSDDSWHNDPVAGYEALCDVCFHALRLSVTSELEVDWHGLPGYLVKFQIQDELKLTVRDLDILGILEELSTLNLQIRLKFLFSVPGILVFPEAFTADSLNAYIDVFMAANTMRTSQFVWRCSLWSPRVW